MKRAWVIWVMAVVGVGFVGRMLAATPPMPVTGATVDESAIQLTLYVDPANGEAADDDQHGGADAPFATLHYACLAAARAKDANRGVRVMLANGTYRETASIPAPAEGKKDTDAPLVIEGTERDQAIIDGADTEGWSASTWKEEGGNWTHPWPFARAAGSLPGWPGRSPANKGTAAVASAAYRRGDLLIVNGNLLRQVNASADLQPGTFWVKTAVPAFSSHRGNGPVSAGPGGASVTVQPPEDTPLTEAIIQVGVRPLGLSVEKRRNVVVRGLMIQHTANPTAPNEGGAASNGVLFNECANVLVEDVLSQWNDGRGLAISRGEANWTLRRVRLLHNGATGLEVGGASNLLAEDGEASFNNYRGQWADWIDPHDLAGILAQGVTGSTWRRQRVVSNFCRGAWFVGATHLTLEEAVVRDNVVSGMLVDTSAGPSLVKRCLVLGTKLHPSVREGTANPAAVSIYASPDVTLEGNVVAGNAAPALGLSDLLPDPTQRGVRPTQAAASGPVPRAERHTLRHNVVYGQNAGQMLCDWPGSDRAGAGTFAAFYPTLTLDENCFWDPAATEVFATFDRAGRRSTGMNFEAWRAFLTGRAGAKAGTGGKAVGESSQWMDPLFADPVEGDFRLREGSPVKEWGLPVDEDSAGQ